MSSYLHSVPGVDAVRTQLTGWAKSFVESSTQPQVTELTNELKQEKERRQELEVSVRSLRAHCGQLNHQLESAQDEVETLKGFLSTYNTLSAEEVKNLLKEINDLIDAVVCDNAHRYLADVPKLSRTVMPSRDVLQELEKILSPSFVGVLQGLSPEASYALFLVQSAWQACVVNRVHAMLMSFSPVSTEPQTDQLFLKVGREIRQGELQPVYGRWRALTHQYLRLASGGMEAENAAIASAIQGAIQDCYDVACMLPQTPEFDRQEFASAWEEALKDVFTKTVKMATALREGIVSSDHWPLAPPLGQFGHFDRQNMVTSERENIPPDGNEVLCTLRLGMGFISKKRDGQKGVKDGWVVLQPAEVLTMHCLEEAVRAVP